MKKLAFRLIVTALVNTAWVHSSFSQPKPKFDMGVTQMIFLSQFHDGRSKVPIAALNKNTRHLSNR